MNRFLAAAALAGSLTAVSAPAQAQPCVATPTSPVASACVLNVGPSGRGASVAVIPGGYVFVLAGCYYPDGRPRYYVGVGTSATGLVHVDAPVGGVSCV